MHLPCGSREQMHMNPDETFTLTASGQRYKHREEIMVRREIDRMATDFNFAVSERFLASAPDHRGRPGDKLPAGAVSGTHGRQRRRSGPDRLHRQLSAPG